jgi:hypothetical protein
MLLTPVNFQDFFKEALVSYFIFLFEHWAGETEENHENLGQILTRGLPNPN